VTKNAREAEMIAVMRAYLAREGLALVRAADTTFGLDEQREFDALHGMARLVADVVITNVYK